MKANRSEHSSGKKARYFRRRLILGNQIFNGSGSEPARFLAVTSAPCMMNLIHNTDFIFNCPYVFSDRYHSQEDYFGNPGTWYSGRTWNTNFVADVKNLKLLEWKERGGGSQVRLELSENTLCGHISQFAVGSYKKAHFHGLGAHMIILAGNGYSLLWPRGREIKRFDWKPGSLVVPRGGWFHQHFNSGSVPVRYLAMRWGSQKYHEMWAEGRGKADVDVKLGGNQIEYEDERADRQRDVFAGMRQSRREQFDGKVLHGEMRSKTSAQYYH
jgi:oxalate decarboxylase/phosphoglucose isomerase-like protein (cupin superfamily)